MSDKLKNIILFAGILLVLGLGYAFFSGNKDEAPLVATDYLDTDPASTATPGSLLASDFLPILLSIRGIHLDTSIFNDPAFLSLRDSSIELVPDGNEGRPNPFAPIGSDVVAAPVAAQPLPSAGQ
jgi:hypothetical protein